MKVKKRISNIRDKSGQKGPWALFFQKDEDGSHAGKDQNAFGDVATLILKGGDGIYEVDIVKGEKFFEWISINKVGTAEGGGVNGSGHGGDPKPPPASPAALTEQGTKEMNKMIASYMMGQSLGAAATAVAGYYAAVGEDVRQMDMDQVAKDVTDVSRILLNGTRETMKKKPANGNHAPVGAE